MKQEFIDRLVCPDTRAALAEADGRLVERINAAIAAGKIKNRAGHTLTTKLDTALVRADGALAYPVIDDIPRMLIDEAIPLAQLEG